MKRLAIPVVLFAVLLPACDAINIPTIEDVNTAQRHVREVQDELARQKAELTALRDAETDPERREVLSENLDRMGKLEAQVAELQKAADGFKERLSKLPEGATRADVGIAAAKEVVKAAQPYIPPPWGGLLTLGLGAAAAVSEVFRRRTRTEANVNLAAATENRNAALGIARAIETARRTNGGGVKFDESDRHILEMMGPAAKAIVDEAQKSLPKVVSARPAA